MFNQIGFTKEQLISIRANAQVVVEDIESLLAYDEVHEDEAEDLQLDQRKETNQQVMDIIDAYYDMPREEVK